METNQEHMKKWEYLQEHIQLEYPDNTVEKILERRGEEGWELVQYETKLIQVPDTRSTIVSVYCMKDFGLLTFKRKKKKQDKITFPYFRNTGDKTVEGLTDIKVAEEKK